MSDDTKLVPTSEQPDYEKLIADLKAIIAEGRGKVIATINSQLVHTYWRIGERIAQEEQHGQARARYGEELLKRVGQSLSAEIGRGFTERELRRMRQFYLTYPIRSALRAELTWTHYRTLIQLPDEAIRDFYADLAVRGRWSSRELEKQINSQLHARMVQSKKPDETIERALTTGERTATTVDETFKDPYVLDFLHLTDPYSESDLEAAIIHNIEKFILELGNGFCFIGRQQRMTIGGEDYYVDLVFYHRDLRRLVLIDLKVGKFQPGDAAQMQLYLEWMSRHDKRPSEEDPIGLILCGSKDEQVIELLAARGHTRDIKIAQFLTLESVEAIKRRMAELARAKEHLQEGKKEGDDTKP